MGQTYLLLGPEKGLKEDAIQKIRSQIGQCDTSKFYAFEDYEAELFAQLNNNDLFADHKLVILDEVQDIKTADKAPSRWAPSFPNKSAAFRASPSSPSPSRGSPEPSRRQSSASTAV